MDPEQALRDATAHLRAGARVDAAEALAAYRAWRRGGGYEPNDGDRRARELARRLAASGQDGNVGDSNGPDGSTVTLAAAVDAILTGLLRRADAER